MNCRGHTAPVSLDVIHTVFLNMIRLFVGSISLLCSSAKFFHFPISQPIILVLALIELTQAEISKSCLSLKSQNQQDCVNSK